MLLRTRILIALLGAFLAVTAIIIIQNFISREQIQTALIQEASLGQNVIWKKIISSSHDQMEFYAYDSKPGTPSIWALRGKRSALAAVEKKNAKLITRVIGKFYTGLSDSNVIDHLFIFDENGEPIHYLSQEKIPPFELTRVATNALNKETTHKTISGFSP